MPMRPDLDVEEGPNAPLINERGARQFFQFGGQGAEKDSAVERATEPPGRATFLADRTIIELFWRANSSTLIHEWMGHVWVDELLGDARRPDPPEWLKEDARTICKFVGAKEGEPLTDEQDETLARTMERYTREGRAPSRRLESVFAKFREWMLVIYRRASDLGVPMMGPHLPGESSADWCRTGALAPPRSHRLSDYVFCIYYSEQ
jgi:hypothetical protein